MTAAPGFGPLLGDDGTQFRLWAPAAERVDLVIDASQPMQSADGWFVATVADAAAGTRYRFRIDGKDLVPDPASRFQPQDVHGPSEVVDHHYPWTCTNWKGRPWHEASILEVHVGTFTPQGGFRAAIDRLDHIAGTGLTAIELMPLADFAGRWNWGYDGVCLYAPDSSYGRPEDLKALIDAAHERGLMVFLDVVYNHFGPEGNYLGRLAPQFFCDAQTPWGVAIDYRVPQVRAFAIDNALSWLRDYRFDGLRLDAVHAIVEPGVPHILMELSAAVGAYARQEGRHIHLILENDDNRASLLMPQEDPPHGHYRAQWNDDYHHAWHVMLTKETRGYYKDYVDSGPCIARALADGFVYQGEFSAHRGRPRGETSTQLSPLAFVDFLQNHDQIGNRAFGERLTTLAAPEALGLATTVLLLSPFPPLLFMGEEWGSTRPFPFFCDFTGELAEVVRKGRRAEFAEEYAARGASPPDPLARATMEQAKLDWDALRGDAAAKRLALVKALLRARQKHIEPLVPHIISGSSKASFEDGVLLAQWHTPERSLHLAANLSAKTKPEAVTGCNLIVWGEAGELPPWSVLVGIGAPS